MILIVDDRPENIFALKSILELHKFQVDTADSGEIALKKVLQHHYSLIILDVQMPGMDGFEVAENILGYSKSKDTPIIFLSAISKEKKFITKGFESGAIDYITKPVDPDILLLKVKSQYVLSEQKKELKKTQQLLLEEIAIRKSAEDELSKRNTELKSLIEALPQLAFTLNPSGQIEFTNSEWLLFAESSQAFPETHPDDPTLSSLFEKQHQSHKVITSEMRLRHRKKGEFLPFLLRMAPVEQENEIMKWVGTFTDISMQKNANELLEQKIAERTKALQSSNQELQESNNDLQQFAWVISHDLKEPIRKIMTFGNYIKDKYFRDNSPAQEDFNRILRASERMTSLINDLLDYSRISATEKFQTMPLAQIIDDVLSDLDYKIEQQNAKITVGKMPVLEVIPNYVRQVFQNLISNSLKFAKPGTPPEISIISEPVESLDFNSPVAAKEGNYCRITVTDNGIGFDEQFKEKIFMVFQRLSTERKEEGTGIGLAIAKKSVEKHKGIITAKSRKDKGSSFIIILPVKQHN